MLKNCKIGLIITVFLNLATFCLILPSFSNPKGAIFIFELKGDVQLKKAGKSQFRRAEVGDLLDFNDQLRLGRNASATILCSSEKQWKVPSGRTSLVAQGCPSIIRNNPESPTRG